MTVFATMPSNDMLDSTKFQTQKENPALASKMDGGYVVTRPRTTRRPRRTFTVGFTSLVDVKKVEFDVFFDSMFGGSNIFTWIHSTTKEVIPVRFTTDTTLQWQFTGVGTYSMWDVTFKLEEA
jgi:hypothetical protein